MSRFKIWLEAALEENDWTVAALSRRAHMDRRTVERNREGENNPQPGTIQRLARAAGYDPLAVRAFIDGDLEHPPKKVVSHAVPVTAGPDVAIPEEVRSAMAPMLGGKVAWAALTAGCLLLLELEPEARQVLVSKVVGAEVEDDFESLVSAAKAGKLLKD